MAELLVLVAILWLPGASLRGLLGLAPGPWGTGRFALECALSLGVCSVVLFPLHLAGAPLGVAVAFLSVAISALVALRVVRGTRASKAAPVPGPRGNGHGGRGTGFDAKKAPAFDAKKAPAFDAKKAPAFDAVKAPAFDARKAPAFDAMEATAFAVALAVLLPTTLAVAGANVDDWWDLSFVQGWLASGRLGASQMAIAPAPGEEAGAHPRFLWSAWLVVQALVARVTGAEPWRTQAGALAGLSMALAVSAQAALASALFSRRPRGDETGAPRTPRDRDRDAARLVCATLLATPLWIWGTEALPLFQRGYQDKLFAGFVLAPVLVALLLDVTRARAPRQGRRGLVALALVAVATVSVHSLVYGMALCAGVAAAAASTRSALRDHRAALLVASAPALLPLGQAAALALVFGDQGISLEVADNPVVRAHLALGRIVGERSAWWVVHPGAVFGSVALAALPGLLLAWRRRGQPAAAALLALAALPCALLFVPGLAGLAGRLWVPWMLYRFGWLAPVAPLIAFAVVAAWWPASTSGVGEAQGCPRGPVPMPRRASRAAGGVLALLALALATQTAFDRRRRDMEEHPAPAPSRPVASMALVLARLAAEPGRDAVLAPPELSEFVPALAGKPVVALPERGTLVFTMDESRAYERLRDRASFFSSWSTPGERRRIADDWGARWAILPRRLVASGSEDAWLRRYGVEATLAALRVDAEVVAPRAPRGGGEAKAALRGADAAQAQPSADGNDRTPPRGWWSATHEGLVAGLGGGWRVVLETRDHFLVERTHVAPGAWPADDPGADGADVDRGRGPARAREDATDRGWLPAFAPLDPAAPTPGEVEPPGGPSREAPPAGGRSRDASGRRTLARASGPPGAIVRWSMPPRYVLPSPAPIWIEGPSPWEDVPAEMRMDMELAAPCLVEAVQLLPHLPRGRREVLEVRVAGRTTRAVARHLEPLTIEVGSVASFVTLEARSLLGNPVSLADVRLLGDHGSCERPLVAGAGPKTPQLEPEAAEVLDLAAARPWSGRPFVALARRAMEADRPDLAASLLEAAAKAEPSLVEAWVELGFARDAASGTVGSAEAFAAGVKADSHSAWARGAAAWDARRSGRPLRALAHAWRAAALDPLYADAWTVAGLALGDLGLDRPALAALGVALEKDPERNWPVLATSELLARRGEAEAARRVLEDWLARHPSDLEVRAALVEAGGGGG